MTKANMHGLTAENMLLALPEVLRNDANILALATATAEALAARLDEIEAVLLYPCIDQLPEDLLDRLAYDFKVDWWSADYTLEEKRRILRDSWLVHKRLGTKAAVERAISAIYPGTKCSEWWEYAGQPYCFKILIDTAYEHVDPEKHRRVLERVSFYKNLRSHLDGVEYIAEPKGCCMAYAGVAMAGLGQKIEVEVKAYGTME